MDWKNVACLAGVGAVVTFGFAGCGGSNDEGVAGPDAGQSTDAAAPEDAAPSNQEYIAAADALCKKTNSGKALALFKQGADLDRQAQASTDGAEIAKIAHEQAGITEKRTELREALTKDLKALDPPESGAATEYLKTRDQTAKLSHTLSDATEAYSKKLDQPSADAISAAVQAATKSAATEQKLAEKFGFKECGQPLK